MDEQTVVVTYYFEPVLHAEQAFRAIGDFQTRFMESAPLFSYFCNIQAYDLVISSEVSHWVPCMSGHAYGSISSSRHAGNPMGYLVLDGDTDQSAPHGFSQGPAQGGVSILPNLLKSTGSENLQESRSSSTLQLYKRSFNSLIDEYNY